ncbi:kininogen-1 [Mustelus asterias]
MKLLCIALFTIQLLSVDALSEPLTDTELPESSSAYPISCSNPEVLAAVDLTLRKFNAEQKSGHQYALYRVTDAEAQGTIGKQYFVEFSIKETDCPVGNGKLWKECNYQEPGEASTGHCESNVHIHKNQSIADVSKLNCSIHSDQHSAIEPKISPCLGCPMEVPTDDPRINETLDPSIAKFNNESNYPNYFKHDAVFKFTQQVVAGIKYKLWFTIKETECSKEDSDNIPNECHLKDDGIKLHCQSTMLTQIWIHYTDIHVTCDPKPWHQDVLKLRSYVGWGPFSDVMEPPVPTESDEHSGESERLSSTEQQLADYLAAPLCPGEPWKPLQPVTALPVEDNAPTEATFSDLDLLKR